MQWVYYIITAISAYMAYSAYKNIPDTTDDTRPTSPTTEEGTIIGVAFGKVKIESPIVYWWGDVKGEPIKR